MIVVWCFVNRAPGTDSRTPNTKVITATIFCNTVGIQWAGGGTINSDQYFTNNAQQQLTGINCLVLILRCCTGVIWLCIRCPQLKSTAYTNQHHHTYTITTHQRYVTLCISAAYAMVQNRASISQRQKFSKQLSTNGSHDSTDSEQQNSALAFQHQNIKSRYLTFQRIFNWGSAYPMAMRGKIWSMRFAVWISTIYLQVMQLINWVCWMV